jgi:hypothetical protein
VKLNKFMNAVVFCNIVAEKVLSAIGTVVED